MTPSLLESDRNFLQSAECAFASFLAHALCIGATLGITAGGSQIPTDEREARVFFLLPPDRVDVRARQTEAIQWGLLGADLDHAKDLLQASEGIELRPWSRGRGGRSERGGDRGQRPFGPMPAVVPDTVFSVLEVDKTVARTNASAAPVYPRDLLAVGAEGVVQALYVVDTTGRVDTTTIQVILSDDPRFTASVRTALGGMLFSPAKRAGRTVRQQVQQQFRFRIMPLPGMADKAS